VFADAPADTSPTARKILRRRGGIPMNLNPIPPLGSWKNRSMQMTVPTSSPTVAPDVQRQANEYHHAAAAERRRANQGDSVTGTGTATVPTHTVGYQDLGGDVYEIVVGGQATRGTVSSVGETDWVAISRRGRVLGCHPNKATAAVAIGKEWEARSRYVRLGRHAAGGDEKVLLGRLSAAGQRASRGRASVHDPVTP